MTDTAIVGENVEIVQRNEIIAAPSSLSWGAVIAGALAATAITFILLSLGAGIGFLTASPYSAGPSMTTLTAVAAIWIVLSQTWGYACGGYLAARLRGISGAPTAAENNFRDGAHGFIAWAVGVLLTVIMVSLGTAFAVGTTAHVGGMLGAGAAQSDNRGATDTTGYFADLLVRPMPRSAAAGPVAATPAAPAAAAVVPAGQTESDTAPASAPSTSASQAAPSNAEIGRILAASAAQGRLSDIDRDYLVGIVMSRTGLTNAEARQRVTEVENQIRDTAIQAADKAAKAGSMLSFWTFMSLLMGAAAAIAGGIVGGNQRDDFANLRLNMRPR